MGEADNVNLADVDEGHELFRRNAPRIIVSRRRLNDSPPPVMIQCNTQHNGT